MQIRSLLANEHRDTLKWFSFPREMLRFQTASAQGVIDLGGINAVHYSRLMEQISEFGTVLSAEVDQSHGVHRPFHQYDPIEAFPMLDGDMGLSEDAIGSQFVKKIFPSVQEQQVAKHIGKFIEPESTASEALPRVKKFLKETLQGPAVATGAKGGGQATVTEQFYTFWQDEFPDDLGTPMPAHDLPSAPQGHTSSTTPRTTMRSAPVTIGEITFSMAPLTCVLRTKAPVTSDKKSITHHLEVKTELDVVRNGAVGNVTYMIDKDTNVPFRGEVERVQCDCLAMPRYAMYIRNLTLTSMLASPSNEMLSTARNVVTSDCGIRKLAESYDMAMNAASLKGTSRVFPPEVVAWAMIGVDEADVPRAHPNGRPDEAITALKRLRLPDMPSAVDIRLEPALMILDTYLAQSRNKTLQYFCEDNGWANIVVIDPYVRHGLHVQDNPVATMINIIAHVQGPIDSAGKGGKQSGTSHHNYTNRRIHIFMSFDELRKACEDKIILQLVESIEGLRKTSQCICSIRVNEEAMSVDNLPIGAMIARSHDLGIDRMRLGVQDQLSCHS